MEAVTTAISTITSVVSSAMTFIKAEPLFMIPIGGAVLGMGVHFIKRLLH